MLNPHFWKGKHETDLQSEFNHLFIKQKLKFVRTTN